MHLMNWRERSLNCVFCYSFVAVLIALKFRFSPPPFSPTTVPFSWVMLTISPWSFDLSVTCCRIYTLTKKYQMLHQVFSQIQKQYINLKKNNKYCKTNRLFSYTVNTLVKYMLWFKWLNRKTQLRSQNGFIVI